MKRLRLILWLFALLYDIVTTIRNLFFDKGIFKSTSFSVPVIAVGNLSVGGTGKTPQIEYLIRLLKDTRKVAVLSRGYKRNTKGFIQLNDRHKAEEVGDEPLQFFKKFGKQITVSVDSDRVNGIQRLLDTEHPPEIILLDDAFQHRKVKASTYILLTKYDDLYVDDYILPAGNLRESRRGAKRASVVVVTKCPENISELTQKSIAKKLKLNKNQQLFFTTISYDTNLKGFQHISLEALKGYEVLLVTGIANPKQLLNFLREQQISYKHLPFSDHHNFSQKDLNTINNQFDLIEAENKIILTTEKDYVRLQGKLNQLCYIEIKSTFLGNSDKIFDTLMTTKN